MRTPSASANLVHVVELARSALWGSTFVMGFASFVAGFYRRQVRHYRIRREPDR